MNSKSMIRTLTFAGVAVVSTLLAIAANHFSKPSRTDGDGEYGREFNADFTDAGKATSMRVVAWDEATATAKKFAVEYKNGWKIPTYHDYPADGKDQLAKAAASVIGLKRGSLATRYKTDHERMGVIDPLDEENTSTKGRGTRITLMENDVTLADFVIGKKVEGSEDRVYLRKFGEDKVYKVAARFEVSTKFADWAETDLLKTSGWDITQLRGSRPIIEERRRVGDEVVELTREKSGDPWKLVGIDDASEELKSDDVNTMVTTLDDLRLVGVRPRPSNNGKPVLDSDLRVSRDLVKSLAKELAAANQIPFSRAIEERVEAELEAGLMRDLGEKGFFVLRDKEDEEQRRVISREGELAVGTKDGVLYRLSFGSVFSGTEEEIEIGAKEEAAADGKDAKKPAAKEDKPEDQKKSRYLIVRVEFDEKLLGAPPVEPTKPMPPPGVEPLADPKGDDKKEPATKDSDKDSDKKEENKPGDSKPEPKSDEPKDAKKPDDAKKDSDKADGANGDDSVAANQEEKKAAAKSDKDEPKQPAEDKPDDQKPEVKKAEAKKDADAADKPKSNADDSKKDEAKPAEAKPDEPKKDLKAEYFEAVKRFDAEKGRFVAETKAFEAKVEAGKQKVKELNDRFGDWYYVISNDSFDKLRLNRGDLVKAKEKPAEKTEGDDAAKPSTKDEKPAAEKAADKSADDKKEDEAPAKPEKPAEKEASDKKESEKSDDK
jgi:hypothetical protein